MNPGYVPIARPLPRPGVARAPLVRAPMRRVPVRRALAIGSQRRVPTPWLLFWGAVVLLDIEFGLAYLLHLAAGVLD
jgi:hypothetical protein